MEAFQKAMILFLVCTIIGLSSAEIYKVGDSVGWTVGNVSYKAWAATKSFHAGDTLIFEYNKQFHNVLEVSRQQYRSCNTSAPMATFWTGNDTITIKRKHHFFICGFPRHCSLGQKVDIKIADHAPAHSPSFPSQSSPSPAPSEETPNVSPPELQNGDAPPSKGLSSFGFGIGVLFSVFVV
ncbi:mavicyanin-like [Tasmannia lanceolata]|uniref:mavicyanin-like n=1 Tax=Tasmannia lanceolata TaxID=3420 RepID=UPI0040633170